MEASNTGGGEPANLSGKEFEPPREPLGRASGATSPAPTQAPQTTPERSACREMRLEVRMGLTPGSYWTTFPVTTAARAHWCVSV